MTRKLGLTPLLIAYQLIFDRLGITFSVAIVCEYDVLVHS
jgi:hypothetical protein